MILLQIGTKEVCKHIMEVIQRLAAGNDNEGEGQTSKDALKGLQDSLSRQRK